MLFPIGDTQVEGGYRPYFSYGFIALNILIFGIQLATPGNLVCEYSVIPAGIAQGQNLLSLVTSMFLHGGFMHLAGNLLFLWIFADNIEAKTGSLVFVLFYLGGGVFASLTHVYFNLDELTIACCQPCGSDALGCGEKIKVCTEYIPSLGASGAISAVMGAYLVMFPHSKIKVWVIIFFSTFYISAWLFLGFWFVQQLFAGMGDSINVTTAEGEGVAWWAHIGGFVFGLVFGFVFKRKYLNVQKK